MNQVMDAIRARRSIRAYSDRTVPKELIDQILDAARAAPSSLNKQPWKFVVVTDKRLMGEISSAVKKIIKRIHALLPVLRVFIRELRDEKTIGAIRKTALSEEDTVFYGAPLLILIVSARKDRWAAVNCALAAQNMMLSAHSLGLGSCFIGRGDFIERCGHICRKLGIDKKYSVRASLIFGYPAEFPKNIPERKKDNVISWI